MDRNGCETHDATVTSTVRVSGACDGIAGTFKCFQSVIYGASDVEANSGARKVAFSLPEHVTSHLIMQIETVFDQAGCQTKCHARIVCPLTCNQLERATTHHVSHGHEGTTGHELNCRAYCITTSQSNQASTSTIQTVIQF